MSFLTTDNIKHFKNFENIKSGFRIPDKAYINGSDYECLAFIKSESYFSNFWYGEKHQVEEFSEILALYFQKEYAKIPINRKFYDFKGMIFFWEMDSHALVGSMNLNKNLAFSYYQTGVPDELIIPMQNCKLQLLLNDSNHNC